jgi:hypothetical protein
LDQPIGTGALPPHHLLEKCSRSIAGFSFGTDTANSTFAASPFVWAAFQILFESQVFGKYQSRELDFPWISSNARLINAFFRFIFATESYGGAHLLKSAIGSMFNLQY